MIKTILFDNNGVLTYGDGESTIVNIAKYFGISEEKLREVFDEFAKPMDEGLVTTEEFYRSLAEYFGKDFEMSEVRKILLQSYGPKPGMKEALIELKNDMEIALLTNFGDIFNEINNKVWHYNELFAQNKIFVSAYMKKRKPNEDIYQEVLEKLQREPREVLFVDDRNANLEPAKKLGMKTYLFNTPEEFKNDIKSILEVEKVKS